MGLDLHQKILITFVCFFFVYFFIFLSFSPISNASEFSFAFYVCVSHLIFFLFLSGFLHVDVKKNITTSSTERALATVSFFFLLSLSRNLDKNFCRGGNFYESIFAFFNAAADVRTQAATNQKCRM